MIGYEQTPGDYRHVFGCPRYEPGGEKFAWMWLWGWGDPNVPDARKQDVTNPLFLKATSLSIAFIWSYCHGKVIDHQDIISGKWLNEAKCQSYEQALAISRRIWQAWKHYGQPVPEVPPESGLVDSDGRLLGIPILNRLEILED